MNIPPFVDKQGTMPLTGISVGGFNYGWPYQVENKIETGTLGRGGGTWLDRDRGYLPPDVSAIGSASFGNRKRAIKASWQNSGAGYGMPVLHPSPFDRDAQSIPKELRYTKDDFDNFRSPEGILKGVQVRNDVNFSRGGRTIRGADVVDGRIKAVSVPIGGIYQFGAPAGWIESKSYGALHRGSSIPL